MSKINWGSDGSVSEAADLASRILKVNHAGENGAVNIYAGQIVFARFTAPSIVAELVEFKSHEERHRAVFWAELLKRKRPRCRSYWLCGFGGYTLGLVTGLLGSRAIAATTVAVERQHHDQSASHIASDGFWSKLLSPIIAASTEAVIWVGMRA